MSTRVDSGSRLISAPPAAVYRAFADPRTMEKWVPPANMTAEMLDFDFREGGSYRMRLTYIEPQQVRGKTSEDSDEVEVRFVRLDDGTRIEQAVTFESDNPSFSGVMRMSWTFQPAEQGTLVTVRCEDVPVGIRPEDHEVGLRSTLGKLASYVEAQNAIEE